MKSFKETASRFLRLNNERGSAAVLLALIVSGSVAATIYVSQNTAVQFMTAKARNTDTWQAALVAQYGLNLGAYLTANNLILCRETHPWPGTNALCKWTHAKNHKLPSKFSLKNGAVVRTEGERINSRDRQALQYTGSYKIDDVDYEYTLLFDLVDLRNSRTQSLVGEVPKSLCRSTSTQEVIIGQCSNSQAGRPCKDASDNNIPNSFCELISDMDQDNTVVLIKVADVAAVNNQNQDLLAAKFAAIRRPIAGVSLSVANPPKCELACSASRSAYLFPACRSDITTNSLGKSPMKITVVNKGPGVIYKLQLLRQDRPAGVPNCLGSNTAKCSYKVTPELVKGGGKDVLFPGDFVEFNDEVDCKSETIYETRIRRTSVRAGVGQASGGVTTALQSAPINQHPQPFLTANYFLVSTDGSGSLVNSKGVCMKGTDVIKNAACPNNYHEGQGNVCSAGGKTGKCVYSHIEPRRVLSGHALCVGSCSGQTLSQKSLSLLDISVVEIIPH